MENQINIAAKLYHCRDTAKSFFKEDYQEKIAPFIFYIKAVMKSNNLSEFEALLRIMRRSDIQNDGMAQMMFFAAGVELIEPSTNNQPTQLK